MKIIEDENLLDFFFEDYYIKTEVKLGSSKTMLIM